MSPTGQITRQPQSRIRWILVVQVIWLAVAVAIMVWWGWLLLDKKEEILSLQQAAGATAEVTQREWLKTQRMVFAEGIVFLFLLVSIGLGLFVLYWRDAYRQKGLHAFFASVTHELRTPLTSIRLQAETLEDVIGTLPGAENVKKLTGRLMEDALRLEAQVERTLELARVEGGGPLYSQSIPFRAWFMRWSESMRDAYPSQRIRFQVDRLGDEVIEADTSALQVVLRNAFENSIRHSGREPVTLTLSSVREKSGMVLLEVRDDGANTSTMPSKLGQLFDKGSSSTGAGVGLYLVRSLMERMGGVAEFFAEPSGFRLCLRFKEGARDER